MAKSRGRPPPEPAPPPSLATLRREAEAKLTERIQKGRALHPRVIGGDGDAEPEAQRWHEYNLAMLERLFTNASIAEEYGRAGAPSVIFVSRDESQRQRLKRIADRLDARINKLESVRERLELFSEPDVFEPPSLPPNLAGPAEQPVPPVRRAAFIVHGHDGGAREATARLLEQLGVEAIILHEQPNRGRTILEKFEAYADVPFAVVLLTPDDVGGPVGGPQRPRARQNVILELGFFWGKLTRSHVCVLYKPGVELPSDLGGLVYVEMDDAGAWRFKLAEELDETGIGIDFNRLRRS